MSGVLPETKTGDKVVPTDRRVYCVAGRAEPLVFVLNVTVLAVGPPLPCLAIALHKPVTLRSVFLVREHGGWMLYTIVVVQSTPTR